MLCTAGRSVGSRGGEAGVSQEILSEIGPGVPGRTSHFLVENEVGAGQVERERLGKRLNQQLFRCTACPRSVHWLCSL